jgi:cytosine/uracil/thiamine/allantoin permease
MLINQPDIVRHANRPSAALLPQIFSMWNGKAVILFLGVVTTAPNPKLYGTTVWKSERFVAT